MRPPPPPPSSSPAPASVRRPALRAAPARRPGSRRSSATAANAPACRPCAAWGRPRCLRDFSTRSRNPRLLISRAQDPHPTACGPSSTTPPASDWPEPPDTEAAAVSPSMVSVCRMLAPYLDQPACAPELPAALDPRRHRAHQRRRHAQGQKRSQHHRSLRLQR